MGFTFSGPWSLPLHSSSVGAPLRVTIESFGLGGSYELDMVELQNVFFQSLQANINATNR
jgi:hypothetical protein